MPRRVNDICQSFERDGKTVNDDYKILEQVSSSARLLIGTVTKRVVVRVRVTSTGTVEFADS